MVEQADQGITPMTIFSKFAAVPAALAAVSLVATPIAAAELPRVAAPRAVAAETGTWTVGDETYDHRRRYRHRRDRGVSAGDVLAGVLIIGGIAAVASAATKSRRDDRDGRYRDTNYRYPDRRGDSRYAAGDSGLDRAVSMCMRELERDVRVDTVDHVRRTGEGWVVSGRLYNGDGFNCRIDNRGRVDTIDFGARDDGFAGVEDRQHDDDRYRSAWADVDAQRSDAPVPARGYDQERSQPRLQPRPQQSQPAYPGGPIDGDLEDDQIGTGYPGRAN